MRNSTRILGFERQDSDHLYRAVLGFAVCASGAEASPPGIREIYHPNYYGAFVIGPDGHNIEAVCHNIFGIFSHSTLCQIELPDTTLYCA
jgi:hypothetical protein